MADFLNGFPDYMAFLTRSSKYIFVQKCLPKLYSQVSGGEHNTVQFMPSFVRLTLFSFVEKDVRN